MFSPSSPVCHEAVEPSSNVSRNGSPPLCTDDVGVCDPVCDLCNVLQPWQPQWSRVTVTGSLDANVVTDWWWWHVAHVAAVTVVVDVGTPEADKYIPNI